MKKEKGILWMALSFTLNNLLAVVASLLIMTLFGFVLNTSFGWLLYAAMVLVFVFLIYHQAWQYGCRDVDNSREKHSLKVLGGAIIATVPTLILAVLSVLTQNGAISLNFIIPAYRVWNLSFRIVFDILAQYPFMYFIPCIVMPLCAVVGYIFGYKQIKMSDYLYYAREKNE